MDLIPVIHGHIEKILSPKTSEIQQEKYIKEFLLDMIIKTDFNCDKIWTRQKLKLPNVAQGNPMYKDKPYPNNIWKIKQAFGYSNKRIEELTGLCYSTVAQLDRGEVRLLDNHKEKLETLGVKIETYY